MLDTEKCNEFNNWFNQLPVAAKVRFEGDLKPALECARDIIIRNNVSSSKFATVLLLALPPREVTELEELVPEFEGCDSSF